MKKYLLWFLPFAVASCGPTVQLAPEASNVAIRSIALLPIETEEEVQRERTNYLSAALTRELTASGFSVLSGDAVQKICKDSPACPDQKKLFDTYGIDATAKLHLNGTYKVNALAGYYNAVSGYVTLNDKSGKELAKVEHTESERGGLLFNSGQIIEAFRSTASNSSGDSFLKLADKFATKAAQLFPRPKDTSSTRPTAETPITLTKVDFSPYKGNFRICATGTPHVEATGLLGRSRLKLREVKNGQYCSSLLTAVPSQSAELLVQLKSPFGRTAQKSVALPASVTCNPQPLVKRESSGKLFIGCAAGDSACGEQRQQCQNVDFVIYKSGSEAGPFTKLASVHGPSWNDTADESVDLYSVIAVSPVGISSAPIIMAKK